MGHIVLLLTVPDGGIWQHLDTLKVWFPVLELAIVFTSEQPVLIVCILHGPNW